MKMETTNVFFFFFLPSTGSAKRTNKNNLEVLLQAVNRSV